MRSHQRQADGHLFQSSAPHAQIYSLKHEGDPLQAEPSGHYPSGGYDQPYGTYRFRSGWQGLLIHTECTSSRGFGVAPGAADESRAVDGELSSAESRGAERGEPRAVPVGLQSQPHAIGDICDPGELGGQCQLSARRCRPCGYPTPECGRLKRPGQ